MFLTDFVIFSKDNNFLWKVLGQEDDQNVISALLEDCQDENPLLFMPPIG